MIPGKIVRFLDRANISHAGTRDRNLVPHGHRVSGWRLGGDGRTLVVLLPEGARPHLIESLEDNGQFSVTVEEYPAHETYQFKGRYVRHRPIEGEDIQVADRVRERFLTVGHSVLRRSGRRSAARVLAAAESGRGVPGGRDLRSDAGAGRRASRVPAEA